MSVLKLLKEGLIILDGGLGTLLQAEGLKAGEHPERWNMTRPELITNIHKSYFDAGSNIVCANTFGANSLKFDEKELELIIKSAISNARRGAEMSASKKEKLVALDIGSTGKLLKPYGDLDFESAVEIFAVTVRLGVKYGADLIMIETMNDIYETKAALLAAKENSSLPVFVSNAYGSDGKLMTGADPSAVVALLEGMGADAIGVNCSLGPKQLTPIVKQYLELSSLPVIVKANAGLPELKDGKTVFNVKEEEFSFDTYTLVKMGARIVGGCCGTTPDYIRALCKRIDGIEAKNVTKKNRTVVSSYTHAVDFDRDIVLIGERINPTGKKRFKTALLENDTSYILNEGLSQAERGAHILDVNVGLPEIDEKAMLESTVRELQAVTDLPLQIDTADPVAMERALRIYNGKAMINSVNGKEEVMEKIFPLVKKYGGVVVALTLDENGIPTTAEGRIEIAKRILKKADEYGIDRKDIVIDTLCMTVSADKSSGKVTLDALKRVKKELLCHTSLGVSNISFGLPERATVNATFFAMALENGLSAAIMNPYSEEMMRVYYSYRALSGMDESCADYISYANKNKTEEKIEKKSEITLSDAIVKGLSEKASELTKVLLDKTDGMSIVESEIIPALDKVGVGYEKGSVFLPQLLMSAEAAKASFERIKESLKGESSVKRGSIVIATVKGDIHDIGKNIVKLLLENYGFFVIDLGKDVDKEAILDAVIGHKAKLVALSALMTTTVPAMKETVELIREKAPDCKVIVGGAVLTEEYASIIGADKYGADAMEAVRYAESILK